MDAKNVQQQLQVLVFQNQRLGVQLEEKRKASKALEDKIVVYEEKEQAYEQTLLCINRIWAQFTDHIVHLCESLAGTPGLTPPTAGPSGPSVPAVRDPFLQRLVSDAAHAKPLLDSQKRIDAELTDVERALQERARGAKDALASVLDALRTLVTRQDALSSQLRSAAADARLEDALQSDNARLAAESASLRRDLDALRGVAACTSEELRLATDRRLEAEERIRQLQNELADTEQQLTNTQKKYLNLKNAGSSGGDATTAAVMGSIMGAGGAAGGSGGGAGGGGGSGGGPSRQGSLLGPLGSGMGSVGAGNALAAGGSGMMGPGEVGGDVLDELAEAQAVLAKRTVDLEREREAHLKTRRDLQDAQSRLGDESWVPATRLYGMAQQQVAALGEALATRTREAEGLARERDEALREAAGRAALALSESHLRSKVVALERTLRDLAAARSEAERGRCEAEAALVAERARGGAGAAVGELQELVASLQGQLAAGRARAQGDKAAQERLDASAAEVVEAGMRLAARDMELQRLKDTLARREGEGEEGRKRECSLRQALADMQAFVDVLTGCCGEPPEWAALAVSERAARAEVAALRQQLEGHAPSASLRELAACEREVRGQLELVRLEADELRMQVASAQRQAAEVAAQLGQCRAMCEVYTGEIENMAAAYEALQVQNSRLAASLAERDEAHGGVLADRLKLSQQVPLLSEAADAARAEAERLGREVAELGVVREAAERELARLAGELAQTKEALRGALTRAEEATLVLRRREETLAALQQQLEGERAQLGLKRQALEEADQKLVKEKSKRQRVEEEVKSLQVKVDKLKKLTSPSGVAKELQEEVDALRRLLNCSVCHEREKNRIITKCCHVFCDVCIDRTLTARNRKCPGCGVVFAKGDVKSLFFT